MTKKRKNYDIFFSRIEAFLCIKDYLGSGVSSSHCSWDASILRYFGMHPGTITVEDRCKLHRTVLWNMSDRALQV